MSGPESGFNKPSSKPETSKEKIPTKDEVEAAMLAHIPGLASLEEVPASDKDERVDEKGLWLLEIRRPGENPGEVNEYRYMRAGDHGNQNQSKENAIHVVYYVDDVPVGSSRLATLD